MSLNWSVKNVADFESTCYEVAQADDQLRGVRKGDRTLKGITEALIFRLAAIGIGTITEKLVEEVYVRSALLAKLDGALPIIYFEEKKHGSFEVEGPNGTHRVGEWKRRNFTVAEIRAHIGLSTNVTFESRTKFTGRIVNSETLSVELAYRYEVKDLEVLVPA